LAPRFNSILIAVWALAAAVLLCVVRPRPILPAAVGAAAGLLAGLLQRKSVRSAPAIFARARSALDVRRAFMSTGAGRLSIAMIWVAGLVLAAIALVQGGNVLLGFVAGYASFLFVRELVSVRAIAEVRRNAPDSL
jgi:hypothetical protein